MFLHRSSMPGLQFQALPCLPELFRVRLMACSGVPNASINIWPTRRFTHVVVGTPTSLPPKICFAIRAWRSLWHDGLR